MTISLSGHTECRSVSPSPHVMYIMLWKCLSLVLITASIIEQSFKKQLKGGQLAPQITYQLGHLLRVPWFNAWLHFQLVQILGGCNENLLRAQVILLPL